MGFQQFWGKMEPFGMAQGRLGAGLALRARKGISPYGIPLNNEENFGFPDLSPVQTLNYF